MNYNANNISYEFIKEAQEDKFQEVIAWQPLLQPYIENRKES